jgi:hypothetical protein
LPRVELLSGLEASTFGSSKPLDAMGEMGIEITSRCV